MDLGLVTCSLPVPSVTLHNFPTTIYFFPILVFLFLYVLVFLFVLLITLNPLTPHFFSPLFPSHSMRREWCLGQSCDFLSEHNCRCLPLDNFFERALVSKVTGNGGTTSLFSAASLSSPPSALLSACLSVCLCLFHRLWWIR